MICDQCKRAIGEASIRVVKASEKCELLNGYGGLVGRIRMMGNVIEVTCVACDEPLRKLIHRAFDAVANEETP